MMTPPSFGSAPTWSSSAPTVATNPRLVASSAMRVREALGRAQVRADTAPAAASWCASALGGRRRQPAEAPRPAALSGDAAPRICRAPGPRPDLDVEVVGFDRQRLLGFELIVREVDELEPLQEHAQHEGRPPAGRTAGRCRRAARCRRACRRSAGSWPGSRG